MTTPDFAAYLDSPNHCPYCGEHDNIMGGETNFDGNYATLEVECAGCEKTWSDLYTLSGVFDPETGETHTKEV